MNTSKSLHDGNNNCVSSRGCSRLFIVSVLHKALAYVKSRNQSTDFPFDKQLVKSWLEDAKNECTNVATPNCFGGIVFDRLNPKSYWTDSAQFFTWWKNNIERKGKFYKLQLDACSNVCTVKNMLR
jgi:hypothetical protein